MIARMRLDRVGASAESHAGLTCLAVFVLTLACLLPIVPSGLNVYDEGIRLYGAQRVLEGHVPYRDFFAYYAPAQFYWPAFLFSIFGERILVFRVGMLVFVALGAAALFALGRRAGLGSISASVPVVALCLPLTSGDRLLVCDPSLSLILAGGAVVTGAQAGGSGRYVLAGALLGAASLFRQDFGAGGVIAGLAAITWIECRQARGSGSAGWPTARILRAWGLLLSGITLVALPPYLMVAWPDPRPLVHALVVLPPRLMHYRTLPYWYTFLGSVRNVLEGSTSATHNALTALMILGSPLLLAVAGRGFLTQRLRRRILESADRQRVLIFLAFAAAGVAPYAFGRSDEYHVYPLYVLTISIVTVVAASASPALTRWRNARGAAVGGLGFLVGVNLGTSLGAFSGLKPLDVLGATRVLVSPEKMSIAAAVSDLRASGDGRPILVTSARHDRVHANPVILYFLARKPSATYFFDFIPGVTTSRPVQEQIIADLRAHDVQTVLVWKAPLPEEPNPSRESSEVTVLDEYLRTAFSRVKETPSYDLLRRKSP